MNWPRIRAYWRSPRRKLALFLAVWAIGWMIIGASCTDRVRAHEPLLRAFVSAYAVGDMASLPIDDPDSREAYAILFATSKIRELTLNNVRWNDSGRLTADYVSEVDGKEQRGSVTMWIANDRIARIAHDEVEYPQGDALAAAGQIADKGTTAAGIAAGRLVEVNPVLSGAGAAGIGIASLGVLAYQYAVVRDMALGQCIAESRWLSAFGWGAAANNVVAMTGVGIPLAPIVGVVAGWVAWDRTSRADCEDGPVRIVKIGSAD